MTVLRTLPQISNNIVIDKGFRGGKLTAKKGTPSFKNVVVECVCERNFLSTVHTAVLGWNYVLKMWSAKRSFGKEKRANREGKQWPKLCLCYFAVYCCLFLLHVHRLVLPWLLISNDPIDASLSIGLIFRLLFIDDLLGFLQKSLLANNFSFVTKIMGSLSCKEKGFSLQKTRVAIQSGFPISRLLSGPYLMSVSQPWCSPSLGNVSESFGWWQLMRHLEHDIMRLYQNTVEQISGIETRWSHQRNIVAATAQAHNPRISIALAKATAPNQDNQNNHKLKISLEQTTAARTTSENAIETHKNNNTTTRANDICNERHAMNESNYKNWSRTLEQDTKLNNSKVNINQT